MKPAFVLATYLLWLKHLHSAPTSELEDSALSKKLQVLTELGEGYVIQEIKVALTGVKQMKKIMESNEEKHDNILKSLQKNMDEKAEAVRLFEEVNERLNEAETQCKEFQRTNWNGCKPCLERSCIKLYTKNCSQQEFPSLYTKVEDIFKEWLPLSHIFQNGEEKGLIERYDKEAIEIVKAESSFNQLVADISTLLNHSIGFFKHVRQEFDQTFQRLFISDMTLPDPDTQIVVPKEDPERILEFVTHWDLSGWLQSFFDFSQDVFHSISDSVSKTFQYFSNNSKGFLAPLEDDSSPFGDPDLKQNQIICKELQNSSGCLPFHRKCQLCHENFMKDCPEMLELRVKSEEAFKLVNISEQQYEDLAQIVQQHVEDTANLMTHMKEKFGWVAERNNETFGTDNIFRIEKVSFGINSEGATSNETIVEVNILTSPTFTVSVPGHLDLENPKFIQYVAEKALQLYKKNF
ncbi:clusterin-like protein 1 isoform 2-T2 [Rhinophrynus dorsalis]